MMILGLLFTFCGCASVEKHHHFQVDRRDADSQSLAVCRSAGKWRDPIRVGTHKFYVQQESSPHWAGILFLPLFPFKFSYDEIRLNFGSKVPPNPGDWSIRFESDGYVARGRVEKVPPELEPFQMVFNFPARSHSEGFELTVPEGKTTKKIKIVEEAYWKYHPLFLPYGDTFPRWQDCD